MPKVPDQTPPATGTDTVVIACKVPQGLVISAYGPNEEVEIGSPTRRMVKIFKPVPGSQFHLKGTGGVLHLAGNVYDQMSRNTPGHFAITKGCPRATWENWFSFNKDSPLVTEGLVFCVESVDAAIIEAKSRAELRTGMEPIDPEDHAKTTGQREYHNPIGSVSVPAPLDPAA
jgi:hypothetical protein